MNLDHLKYFVALSQTQNYTKTAKSLHITQPSLTKAIHSLEDELKVQLFEKHGRTMQLTAAGRFFANSASMSLSSLDQSIAEVKNYNQPKTVINLASIRSMDIKWTPDLAHRFLDHENNASVNFKFHIGTGLSPEILRGIRNKKYDVAFCSKLNEYDDIDFFPVAEQKLVCITPIDHPLANRSSIGLKKTLEYPQVTFTESSELYSILNKLFDDVGGHPFSMYSAEEEQSIAGLVASDFGIAVVPNITILQSMPVKIIPLSDPEWHRIIYMATIKQNSLPTETRNFIEFVKGEIGNRTINTIYK